MRTITREHRQLKVNKTKKTEEAVDLKGPNLQPVRLEWPYQEHESPRPRRLSDHRDKQTAYHNRCQAQGTLSLKRR